MTEKKEDVNTPLSTSNFKAHELVANLLYGVLCRRHT